MIPLAALLMTTMDANRCKTPTSVRMAGRQLGGEAV